MVEKILILDFGSQYTQLIARRVRELNVYSHIVPYNKVPDLTDDYKGIILSGSPFSVRDENALRPNLDKIIGQRPVLAICYGAQYLAQTLGGKVVKSDKREYGKANINIDQRENELLSGLDMGSQVWMSHADSVMEIPNDFEITAHTEDIPVAAFSSKDGAFEHPVHCIQFHPEVTHSLQGSTLLKNFVIDICGAKGDWTPSSFIADMVLQLKNQIGEDHVMMALSGGVDSTVGAMLLHRAIGENLYCFFIDNGLLRKDEYASVLDSYKDMGLNIKGVDAKDHFYEVLKGEKDPEGKRKIIGKAFIDIFEAESEAQPDVKWLGQGTIYPDVIESVSVHGPSVTIKSHHNVGGLPEKLKLKIVEPLRMLFKDEVRKVGAELDIPQNILGRHPFPGPGLGIRILGDITPDKVKILQEADAIYINTLRKHGWYDKIWQAGTILLPVQSVGVMGDERTYEQAVALRAVNSNDGMTAEWTNIPYEILAEISSKIINQVKGINRVVYDISTKPPATIEWE